MIEMTFENYFEEYLDIVIRKCIICESQIDFKDYIDNNYHFNKAYLMEDLVRYWKDSRIAILCCRCKSFLNLIVDPKWDFDMYQYGDIIEVFFYKYSKNKSLRISNKIYDKLIKLGILEKNEEPFIKKHDPKKRCICFKCVYKRIMGK